MTYLIWAYHVWNAVPRPVKRVGLLLVAILAIYAFGECHGRSVQRQQDTTAEQARLTARLAHQRDSLTRVAAVQGAAVQAHRDTLRLHETRYLTRRATLPQVSVTPATGRLDTLRLRYPDSTVASFAVPDSVAAFVQEQNRQLAMADTLLRTQVETAMRADSAQIATLWAAGATSDSLVRVQARQIADLNHALAKARPSPVHRVVQLAGWLALGYAGVKVYQLARH